MSASLVGSEMCIRDRPWQPVSLLRAPLANVRAAVARAVSLSRGRRAAEASSELGGCSVFDDSASRP
eukprot:8685703-Alexandrium_andersonii.AAC.1